MPAFFWVAPSRNGPMPAQALPPLLPERQEPDRPATGIGLCLSGGGYRAMLFHAGVLLRATELGYLGNTERTGKHGQLGALQRVSSVSGVSITAAVLALAWSKLQVDRPGAADRYRRSEEHTSELQSPMRIPF